MALDAAAAQAITLGQFDDFQNGTLQAWGGGASPTNIPNGGPNGPGDRYLQISASNSHLGTNNTTLPWTGNYSAAQVGRIGFHLNNTGANPLALRISLFGPSATFTTTNETVLPPGSGWVAVDFLLDVGSLTKTSGTGTLNDTLANVNTLLIRHDPDPISPSGSPNPVTGTLGIDNIRALPLAGIAVGQVDDFEDGTLEAWAGSASPTNIPSGGVDGRYLQISASNSQLATHNSLRWTGDYVTAGVGKLAIHLNNTGVNPLDLRISVFGAGGTFTSTNETVLPPASDWVLVDFSLDSSALTQTAGVGTLANTLANVTTVTIHHDPDPISPPGSPNPVTGQLGIDNIRALPEPAVGVALAAAIAILLLLDRVRGGNQRAR